MVLSMKDETYKETYEEHELEFSKLNLIREQSKAITFALETIEVLKKRLAKSDDAHNDASKMLDENDKRIFELEELLDHIQNPEDVLEVLDTATDMVARATHLIKKNNKMTKRVSEAEMYDIEVKLSTIRQRIRRVKELGD